MHIYKLTFADGVKTIAVKIKATDIQDVINQSQAGITITNDGSTNQHFTYNLVKIERTNDAVETQELNEV